MRGKGLRSLSGPGAGGITPAHAGKRKTLLRKSTRKRDHPRTCGEKFSLFPLFCCYLGSPPHMRGKGTFSAGCVFDDGITPAHAGKSHGIACSLDISWDHPRTCGEKWRSSRPADARPGSPPHMRGKVHQRRNLRHLRGITPAHAGKRSCFRPRPLRPGDHPRTCGEKKKPSRSNYR